MGTGKQLHEQWRLVNWAITENRNPLTFSETKVLLRLLHHRNPRTGQCNPSIATLARNLSLGRSTVQLALKGLEEKGLILQATRTGRSNKYALATLASLKSVQRPSSPASRCAETCTSEGHSLGPKKEKEKKKEKEERPAESIPKDHRSPLTPKQLEYAEKRLLKALGGGARAYALLQSVPDHAMEELRQNLAWERITIDEAVTRIAKITAYGEDYKGS